MLSLNNISIYDNNTNAMVLSSVTFDIKQHEMVGLVGGSGSGKTILAHLIMNALPELFSIRGNMQWKSNSRYKKVALISQHASSLNPNLTIGTQLKLFTTAAIQIPQLLNVLGLSSHVLSAYPYQLSGGITKRILSCMALVQCASLLIADEPTFGLDEYNAIELMKLYKSWSKLASSFLIISHDLPLMCRFLDRILVMNEGTIIEQTTPSRIILGDCHPYTKSLWQSQPNHWN
jgi:peptide/nickel transport system ATP-binding protein